MPDRVEVGQVWASNDWRDQKNGVRQERRVVKVNAAFAYLQTGGNRAPSRVRLRGTAAGCVVTNHRLVGIHLDAPPSDAEQVDAILTHLRQLYTEEGVWTWLAGRHEWLNGERPIDCLAFGFIERVERLLPPLDQVAT